MRGDLDETLARLARRDEALRRRAAASGDEPGPVEEVAEAVRRVVAEHPGLAVMVRVEHGGRAYALRVSWTGPGVAVAPEPLAPWPAPVQTAPPPGRDAATRLAEMIRRDPSLLEDIGPR